MKLLYAIAGWGIVALGAVHMLATLRFQSLSSAALWFFSGGITLVLTGTLNLLNRSYGHIAPGLRKVCIGTNIVITIFSVLSGVVTHAGIAGFILVLGLIGGATVLSLTRRALLRPIEGKVH
jgi:hypothetical protein